MKHAHALVYTAPNEVSFRTDYPLPEKKTSSDVLVRIHAAGICGSDMHAYHGHDPRRKPGLVLGHEFCGEIVEGEQKGQQVTGNPLITCGACEYCLQGRDNLCSDRDMIGMNRQGAFAQYITIPKRCLVAVPEGMNPSHAALTEPAATAVHALNLAMRVSPRPIQECHTLVIGGGAIGFLAALLLRSYGVTVTLLETNLVRHEQIKEHIGIAPQNPLTDPATPQEYGLVLDCVGSAPTRTSALQAVRPGGTIVHVGLQDWESEIDMRTLTLSEITLVGSYTYTMQDFRFALDALHRGLFGSLAWVAEMSLADGAKAFADLDCGKIASAKMILKP